MNVYDRPELAAAFDKRDRLKLSLPPQLSFGGPDLDFVGWVHRSGHLAYIAAELRSGLRGVVLLRAPFTRSPGAAPRAQLCAICQTAHGMTGIAHYSRRIRNDDAYLVRGLPLCADLKCSAYVRGLASPAVHQMPDMATTEQRIERLVANLRKAFALWGEAT